MFRRIQTPSTCSQQDETRSISWHFSLDHRDLSPDPQGLSLFDRWILRLQHRQPASLFWVAGGGRIQELAEPSIIRCGLFSGQTFLGQNRYSLVRHCFSRASLWTSQHHHTQVCRENSTMHIIQGDLAPLQGIYVLYVNKKKGMIGFCFQIRINFSTKWKPHI